MRLSTRLGDLFSTVFFNHPKFGHVVTISGHTAARAHMHLMRFGDRSLTPGFPSGCV